MLFRERVSVCICVCVCVCLSVNMLLHHILGGQRTKFFLFFLCMSPGIKFRLSAWWKVPFHVEPSPQSYNVNLFRAEISLSEHCLS